MEIRLSLPVRDVLVNQPFGVNYVNFYKNLGLRGHNGVDFETKTGCPIIAAHSGVISVAGKDGDGGVCVEITSSLKGDGYKTTYYHLKDVNVAKGEKVNQGFIIGWADNTGLYTTGDHLHFGLKLCKDGITINRNNGYNGAIDPAPYFPKNWDKSNAYHCYGRKRNLLAEQWLRFAPSGVNNQWALAGRYIHKLLNRLGLSMMTNEQTNAIIYGGWDIEAVLNPAMAFNWRWLTKTEMARGEKQFLR